MPAGEREQFARDLVEFHLEELNGLGDRIRWLKEHDGSERDLDEVRARCATILEALRPNAAEVVRVTRAWLAAAPRSDEDAFGARLILDAF